MTKRLHNRLPHAIAVAWVLAATMILGAACSGSSSPEETSTGDEQSTTDEAASGEDASDADYEDSESPLSAYFGFDPSDPNAIQEQQRVMELAIKDCMSAEGFTYEMGAASGGGGDIFEDQASMSDAEFAATHGYGITGPYLEYGKRILEDGPEAVDPNAVQLESMSESERDAWEEAFWGETSEEEDAAFGATPGGCIGEAQEKAFNLPTSLEALMPKLEEMSANFANDPEVVEHLEEWRTCMFDKGYPYEDKDAAYDDFFARVDSLLAASDPNAVEPTDEEMAQLTEYNTEEIAVASADVECSADFSERWDELRRQYELDFIEENKELLDS